MYTFKRVSELLLVSNVTLYKHMQRNGIEKGKKLTEEDLNTLRQSISKNLKENPLLNSLQEKQQEYNKEINKKDIEIDKIKEDNDRLEIIIRELESLLSQKEYDEVINQLNDTTSGTGVINEGMKEGAWTEVIDIIPWESLKFENYFKDNSDVRGSYTDYLKNNSSNTNLSSDNELYEN